MTYYQPYLSHPGAQGAVRSPGSGYPPVTSPGYITNPAGQQYMQMQPTAFFPPPNLQGTYAKVSPPPPQRIVLNPNATAYQSYTSPSPPVHNNQQYPGGGDQMYQGLQAGDQMYQGGDQMYQGGEQKYQGGEQKYQGGDQKFQGLQGGFLMETGQMYQNGPKPYRGTPLFRPYQNGPPEVMPVESPKNHPQRPMTPQALTSPVHNFNVPAPTFGGSSIQSSKHERTNGLTRSYPDDQSMFVTDSGQVPSASAEDVFKAKASLYGIDICFKADSLANTGRGKQLKVQHNKFTPSKAIDSPDETNGEKPSEMLFHKTHIEPGNDSDSSITEESCAYTTVPQQPKQDCAVKKTASEKNLLASNEGKTLELSSHDKDMFSSEKISKPYLFNPVELNGCVVYSETSEHKSEGKNIPVTSSWSKGSLATNSLDSVVEGDSSSVGDGFITAGDETVSSASDGEMGILGNYVLETLMSTNKAPKNKKNDTEQKLSVFPTVETGSVVATKRLDEEPCDTFESLVEAYVKTIIEKACEVVAKQRFLSSESSNAVKTAKKTDCEENNNNCYHYEADSEKLDCKVGNLRKIKHGSEAYDSKVRHQKKAADTIIKCQIDASDTKANYQDGPIRSISEMSSSCSASSSWATAWSGNSNSTSKISEDENSNICNNNVIKVQGFHHDSESTEPSSDYSDSGSASQLNPILAEFKPRRYLKSKTSSVNTSAMRPEAPVFQPLNVQTLPLYVKQLYKEGSCQTEEKECTEVASNTRRVKQVDRDSETASCDTREVCVNTMESCFSDDNDFFVAAEATYSEQGTLTDSLVKQSVGVLVKPHALDACTVNKETMTEPVTDYLESLIATQRELLHLRGQVCTMELKRQIQELERSKQMFQNMRGEPLDNIMDDRITSLKIELNIIQNQVVSYDAHLAAGNVWKTVPQFTVSIPVGGKSIIAVNKNFAQKSTAKNVGTKRSFWDAYSPEEEHLLRDLGTDRPVKMSSQVHNHHPKYDESLKSKTEFQLKPPQTFSFTSTRRFGSDPSIDGTAGVGKVTGDKENRKQGQTTCQKVTTGITGVTDRKTDLTPVMNMDDIDDDLSFPDFSKTAPPHISDNTAPCRDDSASDSVKKDINVQRENYTYGQKTCRGESSAALEIIPVSQTFDNAAVSVSLNSGKVLSSEPLSAEAISGRPRPAFSTSVCVTQNSKFTTLSSAPTNVTETQNNSFTTFSSEPPIVTGTQSGSITKFSHIPTIVNGTLSGSITTFSSGPTTTSSQLGPLPISHVPAPFCNATNSTGSIITNQFPTFSRQNVTQLAQVMTGPPLMATPRIIPGQQGMVLYPLVRPAHPSVPSYLQVRPPQPGIPPYPQIRPVQPSIVPYCRVLPGHQPSTPSYPVNMKSTLLPQPANIPTSVYQGNPLIQSAQTGRTSPSLGCMANIPTSVYQGNPLIQSAQTGRTSPSLGGMSNISASVYQGNPLIQSAQTGRTSPSLRGMGMLSGQTNVSTTGGQINTLSVPCQTQSSVSPGQLSNPPGQVNSTVVQGQRRAALSVPSSNATSCPPVTSSIQTSMPSSGTNRTNVDPDLYQAVILQLRQAYPQLASNPVWLETTGVQQTLVLQNYIDASKNAAPNKDADNTSQQVPNSNSNHSSTDSQKISEDSSRLPMTSNSKMPNGDISKTEVVLKKQSVIDEPSLMNNTTATPRRPPGLGSLTQTDQSLSQKFENSQEFSMKDLNKTGGVAKGLVKTISELTKMTGNESKDVSPNEDKVTGDRRIVVHKSPIESKLSQKPKSLLDNFKRVDKVVVHEPKVSTVYPDSYEKLGCSSSKEMVLSTKRSNEAHSRSKSIPSRQMHNSESDKVSREAFRNATSNSVGGENWEDEVDPDPKPFSHDFRKVRPAEKTKASWSAEMSKTSLPPGLSLKKPTDQSATGKNDWWDGPKLGHGSSGSNVTSSVNYSQKIQQWLNSSKPSSTVDALVRNKTPQDSGDIKSLDAQDVGEGLKKDGTAGLSVIPLTSKTLKTTGDLDKISDGEDENWHQVGHKKKKEKKKTEPERPRRKSGSDVSSGKSNNFEKLISKMSDVFTTLDREHIIQLITVVRKETNGLSGMNMKQIMDLSRQIFTSRRHLFQTDSKQRHSSAGSATSQKAHKPVPLPIVGMTAMPGPGKTFNFKPLSMSVIQPLKDLPLMDDEEEICVICHDALNMEETKTLECGHVFHSSCIKQWVFGQERTCPNCRRLALFPEEYPRLGK